MERLDRALRGELTPDKIRAYFKDAKGENITLTQKAQASLEGILDSIISCTMHLAVTDLLRLVNAHLERTDGKWYASSTKFTMLKTLHNEGNLHDAMWLSRTVHKLVKSHKVDKKNVKALENLFFEVKRGWENCFTASIQKREIGEFGSNSYKYILKAQPYVRDLAFVGAADRPCPELAGFFYYGSPPGSLLLNTFRTEVKYDKVVKVGTLLAWRKAYETWLYFIGEFCRQRGIRK